MKKHFSKMLILLALICVMSFVLPGCAGLKKLEKNISVVAVDSPGGTITQISAGSVNAFNGWVLPAAPREKDENEEPFLGWSIKQDFVSGVDNKNLLFKAKGVVHYSDVEAYASGGSITLYAVYGVRVIEYHYLTIGWWERSTSGLNDDMVYNFVESLKSYLRNEGATQAQLNDIVIQAYNGDIAGVGEQVNNDANVDIIMGVGTNLKTQGGIDYIARRTGLTMGGKTGRVIARLTDTEFSVKAYSWMVDNAGMLE